MSLIVPTIDVQATIRRLREKTGSEDVGIRGCYGSPGMVKSDGGTHDILGIATTNDLDSSREVVLPEGADVTYFVQNRSVFVDHRYDMASCVGKLRVPSLRLAKNVHGVPYGWEVRIAMSKSANQELVRDCMALAQDGIGMSIGFRALDWGAPTADEAKRFPGAQTIIRKWQWLELSLTPFPCNVACRGFAMDDPSMMQDRYEAVAKSIRRADCHHKSVWIPKVEEAAKVETAPEAKALDKPRRVVVIMA